MKTTKPFANCSATALAGGILFAFTVSAGALREDAENFVRFCRELVKYEKAYTELRSDVDRTRKALSEALEAEEDLLQQAGDVEDETRRVLKERDEKQGELADAEKEFYKWRVETRHDAQRQEKTGREAVKDGRKLLREAQELQEEAEDLRAQNKAKEAEALEDEAEELEEEGTELVEFGEKLQEKGHELAAVTVANRTDTYIEQQLDRLLRQEKRQRRKAGEPVEEARDEWEKIMETREDSRERIDELSEKAEDMQEEADDLRDEQRDAAERRKKLFKQLSDLKDRRDEAEKVLKKMKTGFKPQLTAFVQKLPDDTARLFKVEMEQPEPDAEAVLKLVDKLLNSVRAPEEKPTNP